jgi:hypothetical protein
MNFWHWQRSYREEPGHVLNIDSAEKPPQMAKLPAFSGSKMRVKTPKRDFFSGIKYSLLLHTVSIWDVALIRPALAASFCQNTSTYVDEASLTKLGRNGWRNGPRWWDEQEEKGT